MHHQALANTVASATVVVNASLPKHAARHYVEVAAPRALLELGHAQPNHRLQHAGVISLVGLTQVAETECAGDIGRTAEVLPARIDQEKAVPADRGIRLRGRGVVHQRPVGTVTGDGAEALAHIVRQRLPELS